MEPPKQPQMVMPAMPAPRPPQDYLDKMAQDVKKDELLRYRPRGRAATLLTGATGDTSTIQTASKTLLGQ